MSTVIAHRAIGTAVLCTSQQLRVRSKPISPLKAAKTEQNSIVDRSRKPTPARRCLRCSVFASNTNNSNNDSSSSGTSSSSSASDKTLEEDEDNVWALKPIWCQPPSIVATGVFVIAGADVVGGRWLAVAAAAGVCVWWWAFLVELPAAYKEYKRGSRHKGGFARSADVEEFYSSGSSSEDERKENE